MSSSTSSDGRTASRRYDADFFSPTEIALIEDFEARGFVIVDVADTEALTRIREATANALVAATSAAKPDDVTAFLNDASDFVTPAQLNSIRLRIFHELNRHTWLRPAYYRLAKPALSTLVGNELAMQRRVNLSVQLPGDDSSLLPVHADVWSGDSPYELVVWLPLVNCHRTKSMYILPRDANERHSARLAEYGELGSEELFAAIEPDVEWIEIKVGQALVFTHTLMHGNRINRESETRWSMNCRFKSLLSPYDTKRLGEFFEPITTRATTRLGMSYEPPAGWDD